MVSKQTPLILHVWMFGTRVLALPIALASRMLHRRMGADPERFSERLGYGATHHDGRVIWFHAASLGEVMQVAPLADRLARTERSAILVTTATATGADWVATHMPNAMHRYAPIDTPAAVRRFLDGWPIWAAIFVEGDLWPRLIDGLDKRGIPRILLNARDSRTRARLPRVFKALLAAFSLITCRSAAVAASLKALGVPPARIHVLPDLRLTLPKLPVAKTALDEMTRAIGTRPVWLAASTHPADEEAVLAAHQTVRDHAPDSLLIIAPRHPRRGDPLQSAAEARGLTTARRSRGETMTNDTQVYIADTIGELGMFFSLAPIAFMGGSFGQEGGHNPYEPANFETALVHGPHVKNFVGAYGALRAAGAALEVKTPETLGQVIVGLTHDDRAKTMAHAGLAFMNEAQDSIATYAALVSNVLRQSGGSGPTSTI